MPTENTFYEGWIGPDGVLYCNGHSHWIIAHRRIQEAAPDLFKEQEDDDYPDDEYYDFCYQWMWENGYGRLIRSSSRRDLTLQTGKDFPQFRLNLIEKAKKLCKRLELKALVCDRKGTVLWSKDDVL